MVHYFLVNNAVEYKGVTQPAMLPVPNDGIIKNNNHLQTTCSALSLRP